MPDRYILNAAESFAGAKMSSSHKALPEQGGVSDRAAEDARDAATVLTPPPRENSSPDSAPISGAPRLTVIPVNAADAPTLVDAEPRLDAELLRPASPPPSLPPDPHSSQPMLAPGRLLGQRYEIVAMLGEGGMGAVYKAIDRELNRPVALKVIRPELARIKSIIERFKQELLLSRQVTHRNVIRIYDLGEAEGMKFITMEFIEGEHLRDLLLRKKKLTPEEAVEIIEQVCRALEAAHSTGIIHRDLKPQNVMRDQTGRILVMDFGLARMVEGDGMTHTGALVGTMDYMSPEQALAKTLDQRSDLYAVGLIFYELLTGSMPFAADSVLASLIKRTQERVVPVSDHDRAIPGSVSNIVSKCLERDVNLRYQSAAELLADLEAWQGKRAGATLSFHAKVGPWGQSLPWPLIATMATVILLASLGWLWRDKLFAPVSKPQVTAGPQLSLAILPFRNASGDPSLDWLSASLEEMLTTDVGQSSKLRTVSPNRLYQVLSDLHLGPSSTFDASSVHRLAEFSNADTVVWGQYAKFGDQIRIDATLQDLKHERRVTLKAEASNQNDLLATIDRLAQNIRENLQLSPQLTKELKEQSFKPTSQSLPALRFYNDGVALARQGNNQEALTRFQESVKADPEFALAYARLGQTFGNLGYDNEAEQAARRAVDLSQGLSVQEKYLISANHARIVNDNAKAIEAYENLAKISPDDADVLFDLAGLYSATSSFDKARELYKRLLEHDPKNVEVLLALGRSGDSQR